MCLPVEQVDDTMEVGTFAHRHFDGNHLRGEPCLDLLIDRVEVRVFLVHHRDDEEDRIAAGERFAEHSLRPHLDTRRCTDHAEGTVRRRESGNGVALEVEKAGRVEQVDLAVHPLGVGTAEVDRVASLHLFGCRVGEGGAVSHTAVAFTRAGHEGERVDQTGLAAPSVSNHRDVADFRSLVFSHSRTSLVLGEDADPWGDAEPFAQGVVNSIAQGERINGQRTHRLAPVALAAKHNRAGRGVALFERGAPDAPFIVGEHTLAPGLPGQRMASGRRRHCLKAPVWLFHRNGGGAGGCQAG